ncbi:hypothetical protein WN943_006516 [Citrus x changshan-huyou]
MERMRKRGEEASVWFGVHVKLRIWGWFTSQYWSVEVIEYEAMAGFWGEERFGRDDVERNGGVYKVLG